VKQLWERRERQQERNSPADTKVRVEGSGRGAPGTRTEISLQIMVNTVVKQVVHLHAMEDHGGADIHPVVHGGPHPGAGGYALRGAAAFGERPMLEQVFWKDSGPATDPH